MIREQVLKVVMVVVGLLFLAGLYPLITSVREGWQGNREDPMPMGISLYVTQGVFLLLAVRNPAANRGVITFAAWMNIAHAAVMTVMSMHLPNERSDLLVASVAFGVIGTALIVLPPAENSAQEGIPTPDAESTQVSQQKGATQ